MRKEGEHKYCETEKLDVELNCLDNSRRPYYEGGLYDEVRWDFDARAMIHALITKCLGIVLRLIASIVTQDRMFVVFFKY